MLTKGSTAYTWTQGRKLSAVKNGKSIQYYYDHTGARVQKDVDGTVTEYRMAGKLIVSEKTGSSIQWYHYDSAGNLYAADIGGVRYYFLRNLQGDVVGLIDASGNVVVEYQYDSWGNTVSITGSLADTVGQKNPFRYRGYYYDTETGLYYVGSRYYDAGIRRFISADDDVVLMADYQNLAQYNLYAYCWNNPANMIDENGEFPSWASAIAGVAVIAGLAVATAITGGAAAVICGAALTGAIAGGGIGAGIGYAVDGIDGALNGFGIGTVTGGVIGAALSGANIATGSVQIIGSAQKTGTAFHQMASNISAGQMAMQPGRYAKITFDKALRTAGLIGRQRPDVIGVARYGENKLIEVVSKSQTSKQMAKKCIGMVRNNPGTKWKVISWPGRLTNFWRGCWK